MNYIEYGKNLINSKGYTCVLLKEGQSICLSERGVKPLLQLLDTKKDVNGFLAVDKVVGKAAAFIYVLLGIKSVHALVLSRPALTVFEKYKIDISYDTLVDGIINRNGDGPCPMENTVIDIAEPEDAIGAIRKKLSQIK